MTSNATEQLQMYSEAHNFKPYMVVLEVSLSVYLFLFLVNQLAINQFCFDFDRLSKTNCYANQKMENNNSEWI